MADLSGRLTGFHKGIDSNVARRSREDAAVQLRKARVVERMNKRRAAAVRERALRALALLAGESLRSGGTRTRFGGIFLLVCSSKGETGRGAEEVLAGAHQPELAPAFGRARV